MLCVCYVSDCVCVAPVPVASPGEEVEVASLILQQFHLMPKTGLQFLETRKADKPGMHAHMMKLSWNDKLELLMPRSASVVCLKCQLAAMEIMLTTPFNPYGR